jgi:hypothetical protein
MSAAVRTKGMPHVKSNFFSRETNARGANPTVEKPIFRERNNRLGKKCPVRKCLSSFPTKSPIIFFNSFSYFRRKVNDSGFAVSLLFYLT